MLFFNKRKDGGQESKVWAYILIEIKWLFSIMILKFEPGSRDAYHNHAFNSISWLLSGFLVEERIDKSIFEKNNYLPSLRPIFTSRKNMHKVFSHGTSWVLSFRGPWNKTWKEKTNTTETVLTFNREIVRYSPSELTSEEVLNLYYNSKLEDWIRDESCLEYKIYGHKSNLLVSLWQQEDGKFDLRYGYQNVAVVEGLPCH